MSKTINTVRVSLVQFFKYPTSWMLIAIVFFGIFLRFYNTPARYNFDTDAIHDQVVAYQSAKDFQLPLVGNFSSAGPFTFGPWYWYHLIFFQLLAPNTYSAYYANAIFSLLFALIMYKVGELLVDRRLGVLLAFMAIISPAYMVIGTDSSNTNIVPLYTALTILAVIKIVKYDGGMWWAFFAGLFMGIAINAHYSALFLLLLPIFVFIAQKKQRFKTALMTGLGGFITFIPLLFFNLNFNWFTLKNLWYYFRVGQYAYAVPHSWRLYILKFWPMFLNHLFGTPTFISALLVVGTIVYIVYRVIQKKISSIDTIFLVFLGVNFLYLRYYHGELHEVYLYYLQPFIFLLIGIFLRFLFDIPRVKYILYLLLACIGFFSLKTMLPSLWVSGSSVEYLQRVAIMERLYKNQKIAVYGCDTGDNDQAVVVSYLLERDNMLSGTGHKLGFPSRLCMLPSNSKFPSEPATIPANLKSMIYPVNSKIGAFDFTVASRSALKKAHWALFTPRHVNNSKVRWWINQKS